MSKIELRLKQYLDANKIKVSEAEKNANLGNGTIRNHLNPDSKGLTSIILDRILKSYPDINPNWLFSGVGNMTRDEGEDALSFTDSAQFFYRSKLGGGNYSDLFTHYPSMYITDGTGTIVSVNDVFVHQTGFSKKDCEGKNAVDLLIPSTVLAENDLEMFHTKIEAQVSFFEEFTAMHKKGFRLRCQAFYFPLMIDGVLEKYVCFANFVPGRMR